MNSIAPITEVSIDFSTICQLRCVECSTSKGIIHNGIIGKGQLSYENFASFVDQNSQIKRIEMSNWGEIFLNKEIVLMLKYANEKGVTLYCGNGTNFNDVDELVIEYLVKYKVEYLNISIDGATQNTYEKYRVRGDLYKVLHNIERLNYYKHLYNAEYPKLSWQFIIFGHNEHELPVVKELCCKYNMVFNPKLNHSPFSPVVDRDFVRKESGLGVADRAEFKEQNNKEYKAPCYHCFTSPQVNWNGLVLGCSVNKWKSIGDFKLQTVEQWEQSNLYQELVDVLFNGASCGDHLPCYYCPNYQRIKSTPLTLKGLKEYSDYIPPVFR